MESKTSTFNRRILVFIFILIFAYLGKLYLFPSEFETAKAHLATLAKMVSIQETLTPLQMLSRLKAIKLEIAPDVVIDLSEFMASSPHQNLEKQVYTLNDLETFAPLYFKTFEQIEVLTRDIKRVTARQYQLIVIGKGRTSEKNIDDAYMLLVNFNQEWKLTEVKVLAPPK